MDLSLGSFLSILSCKWLNLEDMGKRFENAIMVFEFWRNLNQ